MILSDFLEYFLVGLAIGLISAFVGWGVGAIDSFYCEAIYVSDDDF